MGMSGLGNSPTPGPTLRFLRDWLPQLRSHCCKLQPPWGLGQGPKPVTQQGDLCRGSEPMAILLQVATAWRPTYPLAGFKGQFCRAGMGESFVNTAAPGFRGKWTWKHLSILRLFRRRCSSKVNVSQPSPGTVVETARGSLKAYSK